MSGVLAGLGLLAAYFKEVFQTQLKHIIVFHNGSFWVSEWGLSTTRETFIAICATARSMNLPVVLNGRIESAPQLQRMFKRAKLDIGRVVTTALAVVASTAKRVVVASAINSCSADDTKRSMSAHVVFLPRRREPRAV